MLVFMNAYQYGTWQMYAATNTVITLTLKSVKCATKLTVEFDLSTVLALADRIIFVDGMS